MSEKDQVIYGTIYGTKVQVEAALHAEAKRKAEQLRTEEEQHALMVTKRLARAADLAGYGTTEGLMMPDYLDMPAIEHAAAEQALEGDLVDLVPGQGSQAAAPDRFH